MANRRCTDSSAKIAITVLRGRDWDLRVFTTLAAARLPFLCPKEQGSVRPADNSARSITQAGGPLFVPALLAAVHAAAITTD